MSGDEWVMFIASLYGCCNTSLVTGWFRCGPTGWAECY